MVVQDEDSAAVDDLLREIYIFTYCCMYSCVYDARIASHWKIVQCVKCKLIHVYMYKYTIHYVCACYIIKNFGKPLATMHPCMYCKCTTFASYVCYV